MESLEETTYGLLWAHYKLSNFVVHSKAVSFILDCDFYHYKELEKCVDFITEIFKEMKPDDWFSLTSCGDF